MTLAIVESKKILSQANAEICLSTLNSGLEIIDIEHKDCCAKVSLYGGQVLSWQPTGQKEVFWLSKSSHFTRGKAIRGGIPLCWPWFGPKHGEVQHGFTRTSLWQLTEYKVSENGVEIKLTLASEQCNEHWPFKFFLEQTLFFGSHFSQAFKVTNLSEHSFEHSLALHSYFGVSKPEETTVPALNDVPFEDKLTGLTRKEPLVDCRGPKDRVYFDENVMTLIDEGEGRKLTITPTNTSQWVLWNPGKEGAKKMVDVHRHGENEFLCLEAAIAKPLKVDAKSSVTVSQRIDVQSV